MKNEPKKTCCSTGADYEERVQRLVKAARASLCHLPKAYNAPGPHGDLLKAIEEVEHE